MAQSVKETLEREVKLEVPQDFRLPTLDGERLDPRTFTSIYYDTPDYRLALASITLRRRIHGKHGVWQVKLPLESARREIEFQDSPTLPPDLRSLLSAHLRGREVEPIAKLRTLRKGIRVTDGKEPLADVTIDSVSVLDGAKIKQRFTEVEVELINGNDDVLHRLATRLRKAGAQDGDPRPKVFKALSLELPAQGDAIPGPATAIGHLKRNLHKQLDTLLAHDPGVRQGNSSEDVHEMRVATRRLRAFLRATRSMLLPEWMEGLRTELKWLGSNLGSVRDLDIQMEHLRREFPLLTLPERRALSQLLKLLEADRAKARAQLLEAMGSPRYFKLLDELEGAARTPRVPNPHVSLATVAAKEFKKLKRDVRALGANFTDAALHRLRIKVKHARYAAELAEEAVGKPAARFIRRSKILQDLLGEHQDGVIIEARLRGLLSQAQTPIVVLTLGRLVERQHASRRAIRQKWKAEWNQLKECGQKVWARAVEEQT